MANDKAVTVEIFTDGACSGNPGPGGWGALLRFGDHERELSGAEPATTNNRMELMAAIAALEALTRPTSASNADQTPPTHNATEGTPERFVRVNVAGASPSTAIA